MGSKGKKSGKAGATSSKAAPAAGDVAAESIPKMKSKEYDELLKPLQLSWSPFRSG